jgi:putative hydrolase of the HAD superfamily
VTPSRAAMVEDMARNLRPAAELGMLTLWVRTGNDWAVDGSVEDWVHHHTEDLADWLTRSALPATPPIFLPD